MGPIQGQHLQAANPGFTMFVSGLRACLDVPAMLILGNLPKASQQILVTRLWPCRY